MKPKTVWDKGWEDGYMGRESRRPYDSRYMEGYWKGIEDSMLDE